MLFLNENYQYYAMKDKEIIHKFCKSKEDDKQNPPATAGSHNDTSDQEIGLTSNNQ